MSNKLKSLGLALVAVFALGAVVSSSASAAAKFTATAAGNTITGVQIEGKITEKVLKGHEFTTKAGTIKCATATFHGVAAATETAEQTLTATYGTCTLGGVIPVHVKMGTCDYLFTAGDTVAGSPSTITATADVKCTTAGDKITVEATGSSCVITIPQQSVGGIELHNRGVAPTMQVEATIDSAGITYETHGVCPNAPTPTTLTHDGTYKGVATLSGSGATGVTVH